MSRSIAIVIDPWDYPFNGGVVSTRRFVQALEKKYSFKLLATPDEERQSDQRMVQFKRVSIPGINSILNEMRVPLAIPDRNLLNEAMKDCGLLHDQFPFFLGFSAISAARRNNVPVLCSFHVQPENLLYNLGIRSRLLTFLLYKLFVSAFYNRADLVVAPSEFAAEALLAHGLKRPVRVISNGVPERFLIASHKKLNNQERIEILSVGRLAREKQQSVILHAVAKSEYRESINLTLVGSGPVKGELEKLARSIDLKVCIDSVSDESLMNLYASADLFIHAGEIELEGMSVVEAMAATNTVLVSDSADSATARLVNNEKALFRNRDADDLARKIDYWISHPEERVAEAVKNHTWASKRTHSLSVEAMASVYEELLASESLEVSGKTQFE